MLVTSELFTVATFHYIVHISAVQRQCSLRVRIGFVSILILAIVVQIATVTICGAAQIFEVAWAPSLASLLASTRTDMTLFWLSGRYSYLLRDVFGPVLLVCCNTLDTHSC